MKQMIATILMTLLVATTAFADTATERDKTKKGAIIGGTVGAILGAVIGNNRGSHNSTRGAVVGAAAGTAAGALIGVMMDRQERALRKIDGVNVTRISDDELKVTVRNDVLFDFNSATLRSASRDALREMASVFDKYPDTRIAVRGYTDSVGSARYNEMLSERRAGSVSRYLSNLGVDDYRLDSVGYGESGARASNSTPSGRQLNRRVEIVIKATRA